MEILHFDELESTQLWLIDKIKSKAYQAPILVTTQKQTQGIGSRGNTWQSVKEGLYFSFALDLKSLPQDLPSQSLSIYYGFLLKIILTEKGSKVWLKWPNDFYLGDCKIGGIISTKIQETIIVGIGLNLVSENNLKALDIGIDKEMLLKELIKKINYYSWKQIFSQYKLEFSFNLKQKFHYQGQLMELEKAILCDDGSILIEGKRFYSLR